MTKKYISVKKGDKIMNFGQALIALKKDEIVQRKKWDKKDKYLIYDPEKGKLFTQIVMKKPILWSPSQKDILADDWLKVASTRIIPLSKKEDSDKNDVISVKSPWLNL